MANAAKVAIASDLFGSERLKMTFVAASKRGHLQCAEFSVSFSQMFYG